MNLLGRAAAALGVDRAVATTLLARAWSVFAGVLTIGVIGHYLTPELQGYYFTFASLIALQVVVELGLTYAIVQFASHEMAALSWTVDGRVAGDAGARRRLQSLLRFALAWFTAAATLMVVVLVPIGATFLGWEGGASATAASAVVAWRWLVPLAALNLVIAAVLSLLEGCGRVTEVSTARLLQAVTGYAALWAAMAEGGGLWSLVAQAAAALLAGLAWLLWLHRRFFADLLAMPAHLPGIAWRSEIWPFQWRIAVSWGSGYLIAQLFSPLLFATHGPVPAGQMGLSLQVFGALNLLALAWITAQTPTYGRLMARQQGPEAERLFVRALLQSGAVLLLLVVVLLGIVWALEQNGSPYAQRALPLPLMLGMAVVTLANHVVFAAAALLRSRREEPFMALSVCHGLATAGLSVAWIPAHGLAGAVAAYVVATVGVSLVGGTAIFLHQRKAGWSVAPRTPQAESAP